MTRILRHASLNGCIRTWAGNRLILIYGTRVSRCNFWYIYFFFVVHGLTTLKTPEACRRTTGEIYYGTPRDVIIVIIIKYAHRRRTSTATNILSPTDVFVFTPDWPPAYACFKGINKHELYSTTTTTTLRVCTHYNTIMFTYLPNYQLLRDYSNNCYTPCL